MKLGNYLIVSLPDFARHFTAAAFWENRKQFVRDMHPDKVYYWNEDLKQAYFDVARWIKGGNAASGAERKAGIEALERLAGQTVGIEQFNGFDDAIDFSSPIISVRAGRSLSLPEYVPGTSQSVNLRLHKIEVYGQSFKPSVISIGGDSVILRAGEFVYVTALDDKFIEFLPTHLHNDKFDMYLGSDPGAFSSTLYVRNLNSDNQFVYRDVFSFALTDDGYVFVDKDNKLVIESVHIYDYMPLFNEDSNIFYVKSDRNNCIVLHRDGTLISLREKAFKYQVIRADINSDKIRYITV